MTTRTPIDEFKRSLASATKAISGKPEMEVSFGAAVASVMPNPAQIAKAQLGLYGCGTKNMGDRNGQT
jgi:cobaltochelatase CobT